MVTSSGIVAALTPHETCIMLCAAGPLPSKKNGIATLASVHRVISYLIAAVRPYTHAAFCCRTFPLVLGKTEKSFG